MKILTATPITSSPLTDQWQVNGATDHASAVNDTTVFATATLADSNGNTFYAHVQDLSRFFNAYTYATQDMVGLRTADCDTSKYTPNNGNGTYTKDGVTYDYDADGGDRFVYVADISKFQVGQTVAILEGLQANKVPYSADATSTDAIYSEWLGLTATGLLPTTRVLSKPSNGVYGETASLYPQAQHISSPLFVNYNWDNLQPNSFMLNGSLFPPTPERIGGGTGDDRFYIGISGDTQALSNLATILPDSTIVTRTAPPTISKVIVGYDRTQVIVSNTTGFAVGQSLTVVPQFLSTSNGHPVPTGWGCGVITAIDPTNGVLTTDLADNVARLANDLPKPFVGFSASMSSGGTITGTTIGGSTTITVASTASIGRGATITGTRIPASTTVASILSATQFTISAAVTGTGTVTGVSLTIGASPTLRNMVDVGGNPLTPANATTSIGTSLESRGTAVFPGPSTTTSTVVSIPTFTAYEGNMLTLGSTETATVTGNARLHAIARSINLAGVSFTSGSTGVTVTSTTGLYAGMYVVGNGIAAGTKISSVTNGTTFVLTANTTAASTTGQALSATNYAYDFSTTLTGTFFVTASRTNGSPIIVPTANTPGGLVDHFTVSNVAAGTIVDNYGIQQGIANGYITVSANAPATDTATAFITWSIGSATAYGATVSNKTVRLNTPSGNAIDAEIPNAPYLVDDTFDNPNHGKYLILPFKFTIIRTEPNANVQDLQGYKPAVGALTATFAGVPVYANTTAGSSIIEVAQIDGYAIGQPIGGDCLDINFDNTVGVRYNTLVATTIGGDATITLTTGNALNNLVVGAKIIGSRIPAGATVKSITDATHFELSAAVTGTGTVTGVALVVDFSTTAGTGGDAYPFMRKSATPTGDITLGSNTIENLSSTAHLIIGADVSGTGIPTGTVTTGVDVDFITISNAATATTSQAIVTAYYFTIPIYDGANDYIPVSVPTTSTNTILYFKSQLTQAPILDNLANIAVSPFVSFYGTTTLQASTTLGSPTANSNKIINIPASLGSQLKVGDVLAWWGNGSPAFIGSITTGATYTVSVVDGSNGPLYWGGTDGTTEPGTAPVAGVHTFRAYRPAYWFDNSRAVVLSINSDKNSVNLWSVDYQTTLAYLWESELAIAGTYTNGQDRTSIFPVEQNVSTSSAITTPIVDGTGAGVLVLDGDIVGNHVQNTIVASYEDGNRYFGSSTFGDLEVQNPITIGSLYGTTLANDLSVGSNFPLFVNPLPNTTQDTSPYYDQYGNIGTQGTAYSTGTLISGCTTVVGNSYITIPSAKRFNDITTGWTVSGNGIPAGTYVTSTQGTTIYISNAVTVASPSAGGTFTFTAEAWNVMIVGTGETQETLLFTNNPIFQSGTSEGNSDSLVSYSLVAGQTYTYNHYAGEPVMVANITTEGFTKQHAKGAPVLGSADIGTQARTSLVATNYAGNTAVTAQTQMGVSTPWSVSGVGDGSASFSATLTKPVVAGDTTLNIDSNDLFPSLYPDVYQSNTFCPPEIGRVAGYVASGVSIIPYVPTTNAPNDKFFIDIADDVYEVLGVTSDEAGYYINLVTPTTQAYADLSAIHLDSYVVGDTYDDITLPHFYINRSFAATTIANSTNMTIVYTLTTLTTGLTIIGDGIPEGTTIVSFTSGGGGAGVAVLSNPASKTNSTPVTISIDAAIKVGQLTSTIYTTPIAYPIPSGSTITLTFGNVTTSVVTTADTNPNAAQISVTPFTPQFTFNSVIGTNGVLFPTSDSDAELPAYGTLGVYGLTQNIPQGQVLLLSCNGNYQQIVTDDTATPQTQSVAVVSFDLKYAFDSTYTGFTFTANTTAGDYTLTSASGAGFASLMVGMQVFSTNTDPTNPYLEPSAFVRAISGTTVTLDNALGKDDTGVTFTVYPTTFTIPYPITLDQGLLAETVIPASIPIVNDDGLTYSLPLSAGVVYPHVPGAKIAYYVQPTTPQVGDITYRPDLDSFQYFDGFEWHDASIVEVSATYALQGSQGGGDKTSFYLVDPETGATSARDVVINAPTPSV